MRDRSYASRGKGDGRESWRWPGGREAVYTLEGDGLTIPFDANGEPSPLCAWFGEYTDRFRLDLVSIAHSRGNFVIAPPFTIKWEIRSAAGCYDGLVVGSGTLAWDGETNSLGGTLIQVTGWLTSYWQVWAVCTVGGAPVECQLRAAVDRAGLPVAASKGLLT